MFDFYLFKFGFKKLNSEKLNLCSGGIKIPGYFDVDIAGKVDLKIDLEKKLLPFADGSLSVVVCMSAINYFTYERAGEIIKDVFRVLKKGGIARFGVQDLRLIAQKYINNDREFYFQKLSDGRDRFKGVTMADKINSWFYGYPTAKGKHSQYMYDFESLAVHFKKAGFSLIEQKKFQESRLENIDLIDNRPEQMFFLEAVK